MNIYSILQTKTHNPHYLNRYVRFIERCVSHNKLNPLIYKEKHHICPKAASMFPEYKSFKLFPWNKAVLTLRQHNIAHYLLWKTYRNSAMTNAFWKMQANKDFKLCSRAYEKLKIDKAIFQSALVKNMWANNEKFANAARKAQTQNNKNRTDSGEASQLMKNLWQNTDFRQKQANHRKENYDPEKQSEIMIKIWKNNTERREHQKEIIKQSRKKSITLCPYCGFTALNVFGNMNRHISKCKSLSEVK